MAKELELAIKISGKLDKSLQSAINQAQAQLQSIGKSVGRVAQGVALATTAAGVKLIHDSIQAYTEYESALSKTAAIAGVEQGTAAYEQLNAAAREAGRTTVKTAKESAEALGYMALAGWSVEDSTRALMPVLKLSAATGEDLARTSDLVTDSMSAMGVGINDLTRYLDTATAANNKSNQTATQYMEAIIGVGAVLKNLNVPMADSAAILGVMANRGIKGAEAGNALNAILINMQKQTGEASKAMSQLGVSMYDEHGNARRLVDVFQEISNKTAGMTEEQRNLIYQMIGGKSHLDAFADIMQGFTTDTADGTKEIYSLIDAFGKSGGSLDKFYETYTNTVEGSRQALLSAFDSMKIDIGEKLAPVVTDFYKGLTKNMPKIEQVILNAANQAIPALSAALDYLANNGDKVISMAIGITKAFAGFKIGQGIINGISGLVTLFGQLSKIAGKAGILTAIKGAVGALTGMSPAVLGIAAPFAAAGAAIVGLGIALDRAANYSKGMSKQADKLEGSVKNLVKYNDLIAEVEQQRKIIADPNSSTAQLDAAHSKLKEIAELLGEEYDLVINADTAQLEQALDMAKQLSRTDLINTGSDFVNKAAKGAGRYAEDSGNVKRMQGELDAARAAQITYSQLNASVEAVNSAYRNGVITQEQYADRMNSILQKARDQGIEFEYIGDVLDENAGDMQRMGDTIYDGMTKANEKVNDLSTDLAAASKRMAEYEESTRRAGNALTQALASDMKVGDLAGADMDISLLENLGSSMQKAGMSTAELAAQFAAAKSGYTDFAAAVGDGKAQEMAQSFLDFQNKIGASAEEAAAGAAAIANGFENVAAAAAAGGEALNNVINDLAKFGAQQGLFDGLDAGGIADKLSDMAHALGMIPENKSISINAEGNFEVIQEAENQIASLKAIGNVDVSVNANGDFSVLNEATGQIRTLQGMGAVALQVNAEGNIDVLDRAGEVIAQIDSKSAEVTVDGQVMGMDQIENAKQQIDGLPAGKDISVNASGNAASEMQAVQSTFNSLPASKDISVNASGNAASEMQTVQSTFNSLPASKDIMLNASGNAQSEANAASAAINAVPTAHDTNISASGNALSQAQAVQSAIDSLPTEKTITINIVTNGSVPATNASGTTSFGGGLTYLNDQNVSDPREVISYGGRQWYYEGRDVLADIPRGARIYNAAQSRSIIDGSHEGGLDRVPFDGYIAELHQGERVLTSDEAADYDSGGIIAAAIESLRANTGGRDDGVGGQEGNLTVTFSPVITINGDADEKQVREAVKMSYADFEDYMERWYETNRRRKFA